MSDSQHDEEVFAAVIARPADERAAFLVEASGNDAAMRARLSSLVAVHEALGTLADDVGPVRCAERAEESAGEVIGRYKLLQKIGEGGCGVVWMAEQEEPVRRRVALKMIKLGMDTKAVVVRFEAERQALAIMDHSGIAKVHDAGSTRNGRPFFVMELVRGVPITRYCDEQHLTPVARLELFIKVCEAVQHAHLKGIVHRDLKPSNVLVTLSDGVPMAKVIDFGIAKATQGRLTDATVFTAVEQFMGTPAYMSPEQAEMSSLEIDPRSDIYSLGVLLYELLTGKLPFDPCTLQQDGIDEIRRIIREVEPPRPSTRFSTLADKDRETVATQHGMVPEHLSTLLRGDLDWIVMKALEKNRTRRYASASDLTLDIRRHLRSEPVVARPPSRIYQTGKFVRRNKVAVGAAITSALVTATAISTSAFCQERTDRERAVAAERDQNEQRQTAVIARQRAEAAEREQNRLREQAEASRRSEAELRRGAEAERKKAPLEAVQSAQVTRYFDQLLKNVGPRLAVNGDVNPLRDILDQTAVRLDTELAGVPGVEAELREIFSSAYAAMRVDGPAVGMLERALTLRRRVGAEDGRIAALLVKLGKRLQQANRREAAEPVLREVLALPNSTD
jgi:serine/threonine protein kinase